MFVRCLLFETDVFGGDIVSFFSDAVESFVDFFSDDFDLNFRFNVDLGTFGLFEGNGSLYSFVAIIFISLSLLIIGLSRCIGFSSINFDEFIDGVVSRGELITDDGTSEIKKE
jgi:hypothetical protein